MPDHEDQFLRKLGLRVQQVRQAKGITQEQMEETKNGGVPYRTVQQVEQAKVGASVSTLYRIARRLGVKTKDFFDFE